MDEASQKCSCGKHFTVATIKNCLNCGIAEPPWEEDTKYCLKFKKYICDQELKEENSCSYFINHIYENGDLLSSFQHLLIREAQLANQDKPVVNEEVDESMVNQCNTHNVNESVIIEITYCIE